MGRQTKDNDSKPRSGDPQLTEALGANAESASESLVRSKQRVVDHGEVFTPSWLVQSMLDLVKSESERIDARFLEPACGSGNFLTEVLNRKLHTVHQRYGKSSFEQANYSLLAVMSIYGIEILLDNVEECRLHLQAVLNHHCRNNPRIAELRAAAGVVLESNIVHADALTMSTAEGNPIVFPEWGYLGKGNFQRRDFEYESLTMSSHFSEEGTLFENLSRHEIFTPIRVYPVMKMGDIANG